MQFIVLIFLRSVLFFCVAFTRNLSGAVRDGVQAVTVFAHGFLSTEKR